MEESKRATAAQDVAKLAPFDVKGGSAIAVSAGESVDLRAKITISSACAMIDESSSFKAMAVSETLQSRRARWSGGRGPGSSRLNDWWESGRARR